uniref:ShKT domain-containing protein n=1 Tax=Parascaris equorum TaxID=6256 RepID=A0A914S629_PAREQ
MTVKEPVLGCQSLDSWACIFYSGPCAGLCGACPASVVSYRPSYK